MGRGSAGDRNDVGLTGEGVGPYLEDPSGGDGVGGDEVGRGFEGDLNGVGLDAGDGVDTGSELKLAVGSGLVGNCDDSFGVDSGGFTNALDRGARRNTGDSFGVGGDW